jgi:hypothetical protein
MLYIEQINQSEPKGYQIKRGRSRMEAFGIIGMSLGTMGFIFALSAQAKIAKLEKQLKKAGILDKEYKSD